MKICRFTDPETQRPAFGVIEGELAVVIGRRCRRLSHDEARQKGRTSALAFPVAHVIRYISQAMTLEPGDLIATGTPAGVGPLFDGDVCEVEVEGVGILRNTVRAARA